VRSFRPACIAALALVIASCAKKEAPTGGPPDLEPPRIVSSEPDSGTAGVATTARLAVTFSENMEPRSAAEAASLAPPVEIRQRRWRGRTLELVLADSLERDRTYTLFIAPTARDRHANPYGTGKTIVFSTAPEFPAGAIEGRIEAQGFPDGGAYLWCYHEGRSPDSTARDFDALGLTDDDGRFQVSGLPAPGDYRLWVFADLDGNRSLEPDRDVFVAADTVIRLTAEAPVARDLLFNVVNPRAPAKVEGVVIDSTADSTGTLVVVAYSAKDSTQRMLSEVGQGKFELTLAPGEWILRVFRDLNDNRTLQGDRERASETLRLQVPPAATIPNVPLTLRR
jgi:uncharacterized protein (DUF2141 family)